MDPDTARSPSAATATAEDTAQEIALSVVVPVYNQEQEIADNVRVIRDRVAATLDGRFEIIVVSDGSIDGTRERLLESELRDVRVVHYDRNLGKGYAVKIGALESRGRWVGYVDADLDLDPGSLAGYVRVAEEDGLDFAIGSKRHPDSIVHYPRSRRVASWFFQQFVRLLFRLDVRDTQVGLKVFRREVAEQVLPLLLVKRFAFDIELLAVGRALGFTRLRELPVKLDYRFTGSGVRSIAVLLAVVDSLAVFYRLRILRTYQRKRALGGTYGWTRPRGSVPSVSVVTAGDEVVAGLDWPEVEPVHRADDELPVAVAERVRGELIAFIEPGATPSGNFLTATVPFLLRRTVGAVVTSKVAPASGSRRELAAAAVRESRLGGGALYFRFTPGNIRYVEDFPTATYVVRRESLLALDPGTAADDVPRALAASGRPVIYTPEAFVVDAPAPLFRPHLRWAAAYGRSRGATIRTLGPTSGRLSTWLGIAAGAFVSLGWLLTLAGRDGLLVWLVGFVLYALAVLGSAALGALQFRSLAVGGLAAAGLVLTHVVYMGSFLVGLFRG